VRVKFLRENSMGQRDVAASATVANNSNAT
jgi:hypothetical protein